MPDMVETERFFPVKAETPMCSEIRVCDVWTQEAQARFARARLCLPYNEGRKETLRPK
jgi:hypothetical protein